MQIAETVQGRYEAQEVPFGSVYVRSPGHVLIKITERIVQFSILKHLDNPAALYTGGVKVSDPREGLRNQRVRRGLDKEDEGKRHDGSRGFVGGSERCRPRLSTSGGHPSVRVPPALI